jgi:hypothetical protein
MPGLGSVGALVVPFGWVLVRLLVPTDASQLPGKNLVNNCDASNQ